MTESNTTALQTVLNYISDSRDGYNKAAETATRGSFKTVFAARAQERAAMAARLESTIRAAGANPETDGTALGAAHRGFMDVAAVFQDDEKAAIEMVDDGEERLREKVDEALEDGDLTAQDRLMLEGIKRELAADCRIIERMEDSVD